MLPGKSWGLLLCLAGCFGMAQAAVLHARPGSMKSRASVAWARLETVTPGPYLRGIARPAAPRARLAGLDAIKGARAVVTVSHNGLFSKSGFARFFSRQVPP
ncbi:hypothetical protein GCM10007907_13220 [Chitinimonas prasina]|uniref:Uncharacterized protein n=1 Tax=Chitinimonas prasina TaxID=1434937 RepID=A0ABQ5YDL0_9NEIS|nr:hypothetical protein GCM10007907_13220 [Chitinimonas prasina]